MVGGQPSRGAYLKSAAAGLSGSDSILLVFSKEGYETADTVVSVTTFIAVNKNLQQIPYNFTTTLKPFLETGEQVTLVNPNFTTTVTWPGGETNTYTISNQQIVIVKELYPVGGLGSMIMHHDTNDYNVGGVVNGLQAWIIIREINQKTNKPNVAQSPSTELIPEYETTIPLDSLDGRTLHYYTARKKSETQPGMLESLTTSFSRGLVISSGNGGSGMFIDLKPFGAADSLNLEKLAFNLSTGVPNTPAEQTTLDNIFQLAINMRYLPNGDTLHPPHIVYTITSLNDPRHLAIIARGFENYVYTTYYNGPPQNSREWTNTFTYNGKPRLKNTAGMFNNGNGSGTIFAEDYSAITGVTEGTGGLVDHIWNGTTNAPSQYGVSISSMCMLLNLGTGNTMMFSPGFTKTITTIHPDAK